MHSIRGFVRGRVQGVGFRYFVRCAARQHSLSGYAINLPDGRVEFLLQGDVNAVDKVVQQIHSGPTHATVTEVKLEPAEDLPARDQFSTG